MVNAVDPIKRIDRCPLGIDSHGTNLCPLHKRLDDATEWVVQSFASTTIAEHLSAPGHSTTLCQPAKPTGLTLSSEKGTSS